MAQVVFYPAAKEFIHLSLAVGSTSKETAPNAIYGD